MLLIAAPGAETDRLAEAVRAHVGADCLSRVEPVQVDARLGQLPAWHVAIFQMPTDDATADEALRSLVRRLGDTPVVAWGPGDDTNWIADAVEAGAIAALVVPEGHDALPPVSAAIEQALALADARRHNRRLTTELRVQLDALTARAEKFSTEISRLEVMAWTDPLTGLANRRQLDERLPQTFAEAMRYGNDLACVIIDLDGFKQVNDQLGHAAGDELLKLASRIIDENIRASDIAARLGGDEFVILMPQTCCTIAGQVASRLQAAFARAASQRMEMLSGGEACSATCSMSIGVSCISQSKPLDANTLLEHADAALYAAKAAGRRSIMVCNDDGSNTTLVSG